MNNTSARRAYAGLAAVTASLALAAPAQAAAIRPLVAGPTVQASAAPGGTFTAPLSVTNTDTAAVAGASIWFGGIDGYASTSRFGNCAYDLLGALRSCDFDQTLAPGKTYRADLPLRAPADAYAPGAMTARFEWLAGLSGSGPWTPGDGETLRLVEETTPAPATRVSWQTVEINIIGTHGADLVAQGAKAYGAAGDLVQVKAGVRNNGPATLNWDTSPGVVVVTIPPGTSVQTVPAGCSIVGADKAHYSCEAPKLFRVGAAYSWSFGLRIDQVIQGASGAVEVNPACQCQRFADDLDKTNNTASLVVNPAPTAPGDRDTNPPVVSATGLTEGQWLGQYGSATPVWSDDVAVTKVQVLVDGEITRTYEGTLPREVAVLPPIQVYLQDARVTIRAFDAAGNSGERSTLVHVDLLSPTATVTPAFGARFGGVVTFRATDVSPDTTRIEFMDQSGRILARSDAAPWTMTWDTRGMNGDLYVSLRIFDRADNVRFGGGYYSIDNAGPVVSALTPTNRTLVRGSVRTSIRVSDPSGLRSARVTGGRPTSSPLTWTLTPRAQGNVTVEWVLTDKLGNTTVVRRVVVNDTVAPALRLTKAPANNAKLTKKTTLAAAASDKNGVARVQLLVNGKVVATDATSGYAFTLDPKKYGTKFTVQLRAYDRAGNATTLAKRTYRR